MSEILAPAGSFDAVVAAVRCGANAVYLGGKAFNARRNASNFSEDELAKAVEYCHQRNVKVYMTLNTLIGDGELESAYEAIECACRIGADALILQDLGLAAIVRQVAPSMPLHASTQMSVQSAEGVEILEKLGFCRAVVPRELSEKEIKTISEKTNAELEAFVHGALCMCVSGQCLMSSVLGGRSGNRGLCAQPCRLPFGVNSKGGNNLSLKDLSLVEELDRMKKAGVCSYKIEGRMKRPEYVAAAVTACKNAKENKPDEKISSSLQAVFSRSGFTKGYFESKLGKDMFGTRRKEDVESASGVLNELSKLYEKENPLIPVSFRLTFKKDVPMTLEASALGKNIVSASENCPAPALNKPLSKSELSERLSKCGGTQFYADNIDIDFEEGLNASAGAINALRRQALAELEDKFCENSSKEFNNNKYTFNNYTAKSFGLRARFSSEEQIPEDLSGISTVILPLDVSVETIKKLKASGIETAAEIPCGVFSNSQKYIDRLVELKSHGLDFTCASNIDGIGIAEKADIPFISGFGMNIFNSVAIDEIQKLGAKDCLISCELPLSGISKLGGNLPRGIFAYGRIPLMLTRNCPVKNKLSCAECKGKSFLVDRMGVEFPVVCGNSCSTILNSRPVWLADKMQDIRNVDFALLYFTTESKKECSDVINAYKNGSSPCEEFTRGLYYKGVL